MVPIEPTKILLHYTATQELSLAEVGRRVNLSRGTLSMVTRGKRVLSWAARERIANELGIPHEYLFDQSGQAAWPSSFTSISSTPPRSSG